MKERENGNSIVTKQTKNKTVNENNSADLTEGNLLKNIILYTLPIIATGVLSLLFNAADIIVVGRYASDTALAAVSSTAPLINLLVNLVMGLSVGSSVSVAKWFGAKNDEELHKTVHTSYLTAIIGGLLLGVFGFFFAHYFLQWMDTPDNVIDQSSLYVRIYFIGIPFIVVYNFGASILRSVGDTKRPLFILIIAGILNVILNLIFVICFKMDVDGVAWATSISQCFASILVTVHLVKSKENYSLNLKKLRIYKNSLKTILIIGVPAGIQGSLFSISNVLIQSSINGFGDPAMSGNGAAGNIEGFIYTSMNAFQQTAVAFVGQHIGANKSNQIGKITLTCVTCSCTLGLILGWFAYIFAKPLLSIYIPDNEENIAYGIQRMKWIFTTYFLCGLMDVLCGILRGMGKSFSSMMITLLCVCGFRVLWIYTVFAKFHSLDVLFMSYPISWLMCAAVQLLFFFIVYGNIKKQLKRGITPSINI